MAWYGKVTFLLYNDVDSVILDYMNLQLTRGVEDCNKMFAYAIVSYFTKQINRNEGYK